MSHLCVDNNSFVFLLSMQSIQNLGLACVSIAAGKIVDAKGYLILEVFFMACLSSKFFRTQRNWKFSKIPREYNWVK